MKILFVDDDESIHLLIKLFFKKTDYLVDIAGNGADGVDKYKKGNFDLVLMDLTMPVMDGLEATREIRKWENESGQKRVPVIALTAHEANNDMNESEVAGCDEHLIKPVKKQALLNIVRKYLGE